MVDTNAGGGSAADAGVSTDQRVGAPTLAEELDNAVEAAKRAVAKAEDQLAGAKEALAQAKAARKGNG